MVNSAWESTLIRAKIYWKELHFKKQVARWPLRWNDQTHAEKKEKKFGKNYVRVLKIKCHLLLSTLPLLKCSDL